MLLRYLKSYKQGASSSFLRSESKTTLEPEQRVSIPSSFSLPAAAAGARRNRFLLSYDREASLAGKPAGTAVGGVPSMHNASRQSGEDFGVVVVGT